MDSSVKSPELIDLEPDSEPEHFEGVDPDATAIVTDATKTNESNNEVPCLPSVLSSDLLSLDASGDGQVPESEVGEVLERKLSVLETSGNADAEDDEDDQSPEAGIDPETSQEQFKTFVIIVNNDGSLTFDPTGVMQQDADADTLFPITLPVGMLKDPNNPIPGAIPLNTRRRKTKLQPTVFLDDDEPMIVQDPRVPAPVPVPGPSQNSSIDVSEIAAHLNPQDIEAIENVLQSAQARGILENLDLSATPSKEGETGWDHSYTQKKGTQAKAKAQTKPRVQNVERRNSTTTTPAAKAPVALVPALKTPITPAVRKTSESNNTRRSQRQQDRIERQEAERILAENQQMLQREKEIIQSGGVILPVAQPIAQHQLQDQPPAKITVVQASLVGVEVPSSDKESEDIDSKRPYPKRERKLPALLSDPNYVSTEEETTNLIQDPSDLAEIVDEKDETADDDSQEEDEINEDDPNRLWCICRQPHNNRFMICCDECEDWFHGKCVNVTKAQGKAIEVEKAKWYCPPCKVKKKIKKTPDLATLRRMSALEKEKAAAAAAAKKTQLTPKNSKTSETPKSSKAPNKTLAKNTTDKRKDSLDTQTPTPNKCMVCGKPARPESGYCSSECIIKFSQNTQNSNARGGTGGAKNANFSTPLPPAPKTPTVPPTPTEPNKLIKRQNSRPEKDKEAESSFLTFHVITPGSKKSTVVVPQKQKEAAANTKKSVETSKKDSSSRLSTGTSKSSSDSPTKSSEKGKSKEKRDSKTKKTSQEKEKNETWRVTDSDGLVRANMIKMLTEILKNRVKDLTAEEKKLIPAENTPDLLGAKIEEELTSFYGGASNPKCKSKYRTIYFNLRDPKNFLFHEIIKGNIEPKNLVKMETEQMATAELAQWRNQENAKELEMIKRAEIEKLAEAKKQELLDAGEEIEKVVKAEAQTRALDITDVISKADEVSHKEVEEKSVAPEEKKHHDKDKKDRERGSSKKHEHSSKDRKDRHRHRSSDSKSKDKDRSRDHDRSSRRRSEREKDSKSKTETKVETTKKESEKKPHKEIKFAEDTISNEASTSKQKTHADKKLEMRHSTDSEQELPSSTIKTPDFVADQIQSPDGEHKALFKTEVQMAELGRFAANVFDCSHTGLQGKIFPSSPVSIVGRIMPDTVWDYINKMKKTKEVIVFRLAPASPADSKVYQEFFTYLLSRGRFGVLGGNKHPIKDVYLIPQEKHSPVNRALLPFRGPGLPIDRTHCLLAVVTRQHIVGTQVKRKHPSVEASALKKRPRLAGDIKAGAVSALSASNKLKPPSLGGLDESKDEIDDDAPYAPWDDEEEEGKEDQINTEDSEKAKRLLEDLNVRIEREKKELEVMKNKYEIQEPAGMEIPGLDGIFDKQPPPAVSPALSESLIADEQNLPFFLRLPELPAAKADASEEVFSPPGPTTVEEEKKTGLDDEVYSPSAMDFSDEEDSRGQQETPIGGKLSLKEDEPLPPGVEPDPSPPKFPLNLANKGMDIPPVIDLEMEPSHQRDTGSSQPAELNAFEGFPRLPSIQQGPSKMKININLNSVPPSPIPLPVTPSPKKEDTMSISVPVNVNVPPPPLNAAASIIPQMPVLMPALGINTNVPPPNLMPMAQAPLLPALRGIPPGPIRFPPPPLAAGGVPFVNVRAPPPSLVPIHQPGQPGPPRGNLRMPKLRQLEPMAAMSSSSPSSGAWVDGSGAERKVGPMPPQLSPSPNSKDSRDKLPSRPFDDRFSRRGRSGGRPMRTYGQRDSRYRSRSRSRSRSPSREKRRRRYTPSRSRSKSPNPHSRRRSMRKSRSRSPGSSQSTRRRRSSSYDRRNRRRSRSRSIPVRRPKESPSRSRSPSIPKAPEPLEPQEQQPNEEGQQITT